jgi:FAT domain
MQPLMMTMTSLVRLMLFLNSLCRSATTSQTSVPVSGGATITPNTLNAITGVLASSAAATTPTNGTNSAGPHPLSVSHLPPSSYERRSRSTLSLEAETTQRGQRSSVSKQKLDELARLLARCYFKQGEWQMELSDSWTTVCGTCTLFPALTYIGACSETSKISFTHTYLRRITTPTGTRHGTPGP